LRLSVDQIRAEQNNLVTWASLGRSTIDHVTVDHDSPTPAYEQLASALRARIAEGEWSHGPLPSVKALQETYGVGRDTVLRAVELLRADGVVFTVPRRGTYVAQAPKGTENR
jgi:DNA-binding GntR family transcriptional regulator